MNDETNPKSDAQRIEDYIMMRAQPSGLQRVITEPVRQPTPDVGRQVDAAIDAYLARAERENPTAAARR